MKASEVKKIPVIPSTKERPVVEATFEQLAEQGQQRVSYGVAPGDVIEFPDSKEECKIMSRKVSEKGTEFLLLVLKNGKPAWFSIGNLNRRNHDMSCVHEVSEALKNCQDNSDRVFQMCGKKVKGASELVKMTRYKFDNGQRLDEIETVDVTALEFVEE